MDGIQIVRLVLYSVLGLFVFLLTTLLPNYIEFVFSHFISAAVNMLRICIAVRLVWLLVPALILYWKFQSMNALWRGIVCCWLAGAAVSNLVTIRLIF